MPAAYIHESIAKSALERMDLPPWWDEQMTYCALIGAQGPDPLFYYNILPPRAGYRAHQLGSAMHDKNIGEMLRALLSEAKDGEDAVKAWVMGFLAHYAVDTVIHPFVYAHSYDGGKYLVRLHLMLEKSMDTWLYRQHGNEGIPKQMLPIKHTKREHKRSIAKAWAAMAKSVYPQFPVSALQIEQAMESALRTNRLLYSPRGVEYALFRWLGKLFGEPEMIISHMVPRDLPEHDFLNIAGAPWRSPWEKNRERRESLLELLEQAKSRSMAFMRSALEFYQGYIPLDEAVARLGEMNFGSGLGWDEDHHASDHTE